MNLHEYQGKELFARYGLPVLPGQVATTPEEARDIAASIGGTGGDQGAGAGRRPRQGRRRQARALAGRGVREARATSWRSPSRGCRCARCWSRRRPTSRASSTCRSCWTARRSCRSSCCRPRAASTSRRWRAPRPRRSSGIHIPLEGLRPYQARALFQPLLTDGKQVGAGRGHPAQAVPRVHRRRLLAGRDQPARGHARGQGAGARRQGDSRRQRRVPPPRVGDLARPGRGDAGRSGWRARRGSPT